jgi:magnesium transporter
MADEQSLTLAFVTAHPAEAARILERLNAVDAAALFEQLPARAGAPVLTAMLPSAAAHVITSLGMQSALSLLSATGTQATVAILRQISEATRNQLVDALPTTVAMASRLLLYYPDDSVGAWIDPDIVMFPPETTVSEAIERVASGNEPQVEQVFTVDREQRLTGAANVHELLRASATTMLTNIARKPPTVLSASATISGISRRRGWQQAPAIPVTDRNGQLIGVLRRSALDRALARATRLRQPELDQPLGVMVANKYWNAFSVLADAAVSTLPRAKPIVSDES